MSDPRVTLCVPVFNASTVLAETLRSIQTQTFENFCVSISVDAGHDHSAAIGQAFVEDKRFVLSEQPERLGWVDNCNWLISRVRTPFFCIIPHDDLLEPNYLARLIATAESYPRAAVVYSDLSKFGERQIESLAQPAITGHPFTRALTFLVEHYNAVAFRGLVRTASPARACLLEHNPFDDFAEDTIWLMKLAMQGDLIRVPEPLYRKRITNSSARRQWPPRSKDKELHFAAWAHHCFELAILVFGGDFSTMQQKLLLRTVLLRLLNDGANVGPFLPVGSRMTGTECKEYISTFLSRLAAVLGEGRLKTLMEPDNFSPL